MDVRIDEAREDVLAGSVDHLAVAFQRAGGPELSDRAVADEHVALLVEPGARIEHVRAAQKQLGLRTRTVEELHRRVAHAAAARTGAPARSS